MDGGAIIGLLILTAGVIIAAWLPVILEVRRDALDAEAEVKRRRPSNTKQGG